ncbi:hypothetical protein TcCL_Unassigned05295 [Trypanosoma cruzi]|nr:hypothetical protein TcCL_Unassigned05295 [Trypanosoma cruzi]
MVACASSMRATGAGPATACVPSRTRMDTPPPRQLRAVPWCCTPPGQRRWLQGGGRLRLTHHTKQHALATQLRAQRQTFRQSEAGGVPPQRRKPPQARRPPASPPIVRFPSAKSAPTLCSLLQENTSRGKKDSCVANKQGPCATGVVPPARRIGDGASVAARTLHTPRATPPALTASRTVGCSVHK